MPNKVVSYTQVPITAKDFVSITLTPAGGTTVRAVGAYTSLDDGGIVKEHFNIEKVYATPGAFTVADLVAAANTAQGT